MHANMYLFVACCSSRLHACLVQVLFNMQEFGMFYRHVTCMQHVCHIVGMSCCMSCCMHVMLHTCTCLSYMQHACYIHLHKYAFYLHTACTLHVYYMHATCRLHALCIHTTCTLDAYYMHSASILYARYRQNGGKHKGRDNQLVLGFRCQLYTIV